MQDQEIKDLLTRMKYFMHYTWFYYINLIAIIISIIGAIIGCVVMFIYIYPNILAMLKTMTIYIIIIVAMALTTIITLWLMKKANNNTEFYIDDSTKIFINTYNGKTVSLILWLISCGLAATPLKFIGFILPFIGDIYFRLKYHSKAQTNYFAHNGYKYVINNTEKTITVYKYINNTDVVVKTVSL